MNNILAQNVKIGTQTVQGPLVGITSLGDLVNKITSFLIPISLVIVFFVFIWGGYDFMTSEGDAAKVKSARAKITSGVIGFVLLISSYLIVRLIATIFGLDNGLL
jgi:TRAP-type C4-dicarboxylate transport system permease small subunit